MNLNVHIYHHFDNGDDNKLLNQILTNTNKIMSALDDLKAKVATLEEKTTELQNSVDEEQAQIKALLESNAGVVTDLNNQIATLKEQIASGATADDLNAVASSIETTTTKIVTAKEDIEGTV